MQTFFSSKNLGCHMGVSMMTGIAPLEETEGVYDVSRGTVADTEKNPKEDKIQRQQTAFHNLNYDMVSGARQGAIVRRTAKAKNGSPIDGSFM